MAEIEKSDQTRRSRTSPDTQSPATSGAPAPRPPQLEEMEVLKSFLKEYGNTLAYGVAAALAIVLGMSWYRNHQSATLQQAGDKFWTARNVQDLELVAEDFSSTQYAPMAILGAAKEYYNTGRYDQALKKYTEFQVKYPNHDMLDMARVGELHAREALGQLKEAQEGFKAFSAAKPTHYLTPQAILGEARCLEALGHPDEARGIYEVFINTHTNSAWTDKARDDLKLLTRRMARPAGTSLTVPIPALTPSSGQPETNASATPTIDLSNFQLK